MGSAIGLREDFDGTALRRLARASKSANQARRLLALAEIYEGGSRSAAARMGGVGLPIPAIHGVVRWRLIDLVQWLHEEFAVSLDETTVGRELKKLGYVKLTARPRHHAQNEYALEAFKKGASQPSWQRSGQPSRSARP